MYHSQIINSNLSKIKPAIPIDNKNLEFELREHSIFQVDRMVNYLNDLIDLNLFQEKGEIKLKEGKSLSLDDKIFIKNEQILCKYNYPYFATRYYKVSDALTNRFTHFKWNKVARIINEYYAERELNNAALRVIGAKARQVGFSSDGIGRILHRIVFNYELKSILASYNKGATDRLNGIFLSAIDRLPFWMIPKLKRYETGSFFIWENDCRLDLGYGTQKTLGTGTTPTVALLSEVAKFSYPDESIHAGLIRAMHESTDSILILESTSEERDNWWHNLIKEVQNSSSEGLTSFIILFIAWFLREDIYPSKDWLSARSIAFENYIPSIDALQRGMAAESYVKSNSIIRKICGENWKFTKEQMFFYETDREAYKKRNQLHIFLREMASNLKESFQNAGSIVYPIELINKIETSANLKIPDIYKIRGHEVEISPSIQVQENEIDYSKPVIYIKNKLNSNIPAYEFDLVPVKFNGWENFAYKNKILIYKHPKDISAEVGFGVDTSDGLGENISDDGVIEGIEKGTIFNKANQILEFGSPEVSGLNMWAFLLAITGYYTVNNSQPLLSIELRNQGRELQNELINRGYTNFFRHLNINKFGESDWSDEFGWNTTPRNRELLIGKTNDHILGEWIDLFSPLLIEEIKGLRLQKRKAVLLGESTHKLLGKNDGRFISLGIIIYSIHQAEILGFQKRSWEERRVNEDLRSNNDIAFNPAMLFNNENEDFLNTKNNVIDYLDGGF